MTDLNAEAEPLPLNPVREDWLGHKVEVLLHSLNLLLIGNKLSYGQIRN